MMKTNIPNVFETVDNGTTTWIMDGRYHIYKQVKGKNKGQVTQGIRERFKTKDLAIGRAHAVYNEVNQGSLKLEEPIPSEVIVDAIRGHQRLKEFGRTILEAVNFYVDHLRSIKAQYKITVEAAALQWYQMKEEKRLSDKTKSNCFHRHRLIIKAFGELQIHDLSHEIIERWINRLNIKERTRADYLDAINDFCNWCVRVKKWIKENPCEFIEVGEDPESEVNIFTVDEVKRILDAAKADPDPELLRYFIVTTFMGLRPEAEALRVTRDAVKDKCLKVVSNKTKRLRYVDFQPGVREWLLARDWEGPMITDNFIRRWKEFRFKLGYRLAPVKYYKVYQDATDDWRKRPKWHRNVSRHTFCSYHLAAFEDEARSAHQAGHLVEVFRSNYKQPIEKQVGLAFWNLLLPAS